MQGPFGSQALSAPRRRRHDAMAASKDGDQDFAESIAARPGRRMFVRGRSVTRSKRLNGFPAAGWYGTSFVVHCCSPLRAYTDTTSGWWRCARLAS